MSRLPTVDGDDGTWGSILNDYLSQSLNPDGSLKTSAASTAGAELTTNKGKASGYASLDSSSNVPSSQLGNISANVNYRGAWAANTSYKTNDAVTNDSGLYVCTTAHTSGGSFSGTDWTELSAPIGTWVPTAPPAGGQAIVQASGGGPTLEITGPATGGTVPDWTIRTIQFTNNVSHPSPSPYNIGSYFSEDGSLWDSGTIVVSQKRWDGTGAYGVADLHQIQGVNSGPTGSHLTGAQNGPDEFNMVALSPDGNGPTLAIEGESAAYPLGAPGNTDAACIALYDTGDIWGGATAYSEGYGKKKWQIMAEGTMLWGYDMKQTPWAIADAILWLDRSVSGSPKLTLTRQTAGNIQMSILNTIGGYAAQAVGQDATHQLQHVWNYNATPASATAAIATFGYSNPLSIDASLLNLQLNGNGTINLGSASTGVTGPGGELKLTRTGTNRLQWANVSGANAILDIFGNATNAFLEVGQATNANLQFAWTYNATAANASAGILTYGYSNRLDVDGSLLRLQINSGGDVTLGKNAISTTAVKGFPYIPANAGAPTGTPTGQSGFVPFYYDTTNHKIWVFDSGWKGVVVS